ncbi:rhombosortase [Amphibiibacter pelophylacis]|uniref:Rhombosortase n=1 Tax=Amphibiibacter pelophylacis TaxID=1799477 RepID=A0ACC6P3S3_9BURK
MKPQRPAPQHGGLALWLALSTLLALLSMAVAARPALRPDLAWEASRFASQPWRAFTAALVHWSTMHLVLNLCGVAVLALWAAATRVTRRAALAWALAWPLTQIFLLLRPDLPPYGGLSGVLHAGTLLATLPLLSGDQPLRVRVLGWTALVALTSKVLLEHPWGAAVVVTAHLDVPVAPMGHAGGLLAAGVAWGVTGVWVRWRERFA